MNLTLRTVVQYHVQQCSNVIRNIKQIEQSSGRSISPKSAAWPEYIAWKREASLWLTGIKLLKLINELPCTLEDFDRDDALASGGLFVHLRGVHHGEGRIQPTRKREYLRTVRAVHHRLLKLQRQLDRHESNRSVHALKFNPIIKWAEGLELKRKEAKADAHA